MTHHERLLRISVILLAVLAFNACRKTEANRTSAYNKSSEIPSALTAGNEEKTQSGFDTALYNKLQLHLAHGKVDAKWPVQAGYPLPGAILPFKRIVAYYGNFYSKGMGILGELPPEQMLQRLKTEVRTWEEADTLIPVLPALHYIAVTAQRSPGAGNKYRLRMPDHQIEKALEIAASIDAIIFLDVQVGHSTLQEELPALEASLKLPNVHLGIDPEYAMKSGKVPCSEIGSFDAADINYASSYLAELVKKYSIPPKILVVHRFTRDMVTNYRQILLRPKVQIVINMDGFGFPAKKIDSYKLAVASEPVQFAGFKLFYKNDKLTAPYRLMTPAEILALRPSPIYIHYQ